MCDIPYRYMTNTKPPNSRKWYFSRDSYPTTTWEGSFCAAVVVLVSLLLDSVLSVTGKEAVTFVGIQVRLVGNFRYFYVAFYHFRLPGEKTRHGVSYGKGCSSSYTLTDFMTDMVFGLNFLTS